MHSQNGRRARRGILITAVFGVVAILTFSGLALGHGGDHRHGGPDTGTITSFDSETGVLAIQLTGGDTVSGLVTRRTRIKCEDEHSSGDSRVRGREAEPGDDRGGHGNEPGDDNGGDNSGPGSGPSGHDDNGTGANCTTADLIAGAAVHEAELDLRDGKALFHEVELAE
jgi:hypothetical protein